MKTLRFRGDGYWLQALRLLSNSHGLGHPQGGGELAAPGHEQWCQHIRGQRALPRHLPRPKVQLGRRSGRNGELEKAEFSRGLLSAMVPGDGARTRPLSERLAPKDSGGLIAAASRRVQNVGSTELRSLEGEKGGIFFLLHDTLALESAGSCPSWTPKPLY